jgi:hypothetical protein
VAIRLFRRQYSIPRNAYPWRSSTNCRSRSLVRNGHDGRSWWLLLVTVCNQWLFSAASAVHSSPGAHNTAASVLRVGFDAGASRGAGAGVPGAPLVVDPGDRKSHLQHEQRIEQHI